MRTLLIFALCAIPASAQDIIKPKSDKPFIVAHAISVGMDIYSTHQFERWGYVETDPLVRSIAGRRPSMPVMIAGGALEVAGAAYLAHRWHRLKWLQVAASAVHIGCSVNNIALVRSGK